MTENRNTQRRRVLKAGKIVFADAMRLIDCTIRDLSPKGAKLMIANTIDVPETFELFEKSTGLLYPATVTWRKPDQIGVAFKGPPATIGDKGKRYSHLKLV